MVDVVPGWLGVVVGRLFVRAVVLGLVLGSVDGTMLGVGRLVMIGVDRCTSTCRTAISLLCSPPWRAMWLSTLRLSRHLVCRNFLGSPLWTARLTIWGLVK